MKELIYNVLISSPLLIVQWVIFLILNGFDAHSTWLVLKPDNYHRERNPIARWVFRKLRLPRGIIIFKLILLVLMGSFLWVWRHETLTLNVALLIGNVVFAVVVWHNYRVHRAYAGLHVRRIIVRIKDGEL